MMSEQVQDRLEHVDFGGCPWCGAERHVEIDGITAVTPPEDCCIESVVWQLAWRHQSPEYQDTVPAMMQVLRDQLDAEGLVGAARKNRINQAIQAVRARRRSSERIISAIAGVLARRATAQKL